MRGVYELPPDRCHTYEIQRRRVTRYIYRCPCADTGLLAPQLEADLGAFEASFEKGFGLLETIFDAGVELLGRRTDLHQLSAFKPWARPPQGGFVRDVRPFGA